MGIFKAIGNFFTETLPKAFSKDGAVTNFVQDYVPGGGLVTAAVHGIAGNRDYAEYAAVKGLSSTVSTAISAVGILGGPGGAILAGGLSAVSSNLIEGGFKGLLKPTVKDKLNDLTLQGVGTSFGVGLGMGALGPVSKFVKGTGVAKAVGTLASKALKPASSFVSKVTKPITTAVSKAGNSLSQTASKVGNAIAKPFKKILPAAKPTVPKGEIRSVTNMLEGVAKKKAPTIADFADDIDLVRMKKKVTDKVVENPIRGAVFEADPSGAASALHMRKSDKSSRGPKDEGASLPAASGDGSAGPSKPGNKPVLMPAAAALTTVIAATFVLTQCAQNKPVPPAVVAAPPSVPANKPLAPVPAEPAAVKADLAPPATVIAPVVLQPLPSVPVPPVAPPAEAPRKAAIEVARPSLPQTLAQPAADLDRPPPRSAPPLPPAPVEPLPRPTSPLQQPIRPAQPAGPLQPPYQAPYQPPMAQQPMPPAQPPRPPQPPYQAPYQPPLPQQPMRPLQPSYQPPMGQQPMPPTQPPRQPQPPYHAPYQPPTAQQPMRPAQPSYQPPLAQQPMPPAQPPAAVAAADDAAADATAKAGAGADATSAAAAAHATADAAAADATATAHAASAAEADATATADAAGDATAPGPSSEAAASARQGIAGQAGQPRARIRSLVHRGTPSSAGLSGDRRATEVGDADAVDADAAAGVAASSARPMNVATQRTAGPTCPNADRSLFF